MSFISNSIIISSESDHKVPTASIRRKAVGTKSIPYQLSNSSSHHKSGMDRRPINPAGPPNHPASRPSANFASTSATQELPRTPHRSSPLPQRQWSDIPAEFRPSDWTETTPHFRMERSHQSADPARRSFNSPAEDDDSWSDGRFGPQTSPRRRHRRPENLTNIAAAQAIRPDPNSLYPQLGPYDPPHTARSAPDHLRPQPLTRRISQPGFSDDFDYIEAGRVNYGPGELSRSPTFPPRSGESSRARMASVSGGHDTFQGEEDIHLFTAAMTGLGPLPIFRQGSIVEIPSMSATPAIPGMSHRAEPRRAITSPLSPLAETPNTTQAYRGLAQMPSNSNLQPPRSARPDSMDVTPIDISDSGLDIWDPQPPPDDEPWSPAPPPDEPWMIGDENPPDDELPDYASSQAQAHAAQREEATRRARELQARWKATGRQYGSGR